MCAPAEEVTITDYTDTAIPKSGSSRRALIYSFHIIHFHLRDGNNHHSRQCTSTYTANNQSTKSVGCIFFNAKLSKYLDESKAVKLTNKIFSILTDSNLFDPAFKPTKRKEISQNAKSSQDFKQNKVDAKANNGSNQASFDPSEISQKEIQERIEMAKKMIAQTKMQLASKSTPINQSHQASPNSSVASFFSTSNQLGVAGSNALKSSKLVLKPTPLILDEKGHRIDPCGNAIQLIQRMPTLKANIRAIKREEFKQVLAEKKVSIKKTESKSNFFDPRILQSIPTDRKSKKSFKFFEEGKFKQMAQLIRTQERLNKLQDEINRVAKKTGIVSAAKLSLIEPTSKVVLDKDVPDVEWWDSLIIDNQSLDKSIEEMNFDVINNLIEHPIQIQTSVVKKEVPVTIMLTDKERKKLRRQNRREAWLETQEKIRLGLIPPPEPKVKMSNLMRALGDEAIQDPTKVEVYVAKQMQQRQQDHEDANLSRKLTKDQKRSKAERKYKESDLRIIEVSVYYVKSLADQSKKFKVEANAKQLYMTGIVALHPDINVVVVEGSKKQQKKFKRLMLDRIKWKKERINKTFGQRNRLKFAEPKKDGMGAPLAKDDEENEENLNDCRLVWEGVSRSRNFGALTFKIIEDAASAKKLFRKHGVQQYWDLAYRHSLLSDQTEEV